MRLNIKRATEDNVNGSESRTCANTHARSHTLARARTLTRTLFKRATTTLPRLHVRNQWDCEVKPRGDQTRGYHRLAKGIASFTAWARKDPEGGKKFGKEERKEIGNESDWETEEEPRRTGRILLPKKGMGDSLCNPERWCDRWKTKIKKKDKKRHLEMVS